MNVEAFFKICYIYEHLYTDAFLYLRILLLLPRLYTAALYVICFQNISCFQIYVIRKTAVPFCVLKRSYIIFLFQIP